jgi:type IV pilus assembly protein PilW
MKSQRGFNLIDLLIGMAISLMGLLAVGQILLSFTQQRNTITQTLEAQSNGVMAMYLMEKDFTQAGYGLMNIQDCSRINWYFNGTGHYDDPYGPVTANLAFTTLPLKITDGGATGSDAFEVQYGNPRSGAPVAVAIQNQTGGYGTQINVASVAGFAQSDLIVTDVGGSCTMGQIDTPNTVSVSLNRPTAPAASYLYNTNARPAGAAAGWEAAVANTTLVANLGAFVSRRYRIANEVLQVADYNSAYTYSDLVDGIVFLKAEYGLDTNADGTVDVWSTGVPAVNVPGIGTQVVAIRLGLVARSPLYEKTAVDAPTVLTVLPAITTAPTSLAVTYAVPDTHYRYRTYYTVIPLRNAIWAR